MKNVPFNYRALALAISTALAITVGNTHAADSDRVVADGSSVTVPEGSSIVTTSDNVNALLSLGGGSITGTNLDVRTEGANAHGGLATGAGSLVNLSDGMVETSGVAAYGLSARGSGSIEATAVTLKTAGNASHGVNAVGGGVIELRSNAAGTPTTVTTVGDGAAALRASGAGSVINASNALIKTEGDRSGMGSSGAVAHNGGEINLHNSSIETSGFFSDGLDSEGDGSQLSMTGGSILTTGTQSKGAAVYSGNNGLALDSVRIETRGESARGVVASGAGSRADLRGTRILTSGTGSFGLQSIGAEVGVLGGSITTTGSAARAIQVEEGGQVSVDGSTLLTNAVGGRDSHGVYVKTGGSADVVNASITTTGERSHGLLADGSGSRIGASNIEINMGGYQSYGVLAQAASEVDLQGVEILTSGQNGHGIVSLSGAKVEANEVLVETDALSSYALSANTGGAIEVHSGTIRALGDSSLAVLAVAAADQTTAIGLENSDVYAAQATTFQVRGDGINDITLRGTRAASGTNSLLRDALDGTGTVNFSAAGSELVGNVNFTEGYTSNVTLTEGSSLKGAAQNVDELRLDDSRWDMTGDSRVGNLSASSSTISFNHDDGAFKTLMVTGDYVGDNAVLNMNTVLGDDTSLTDRLHVLGNTSGQSGILVNNIGGQGADTFDGIKLVQVDGDSAGVFNLLGRAVGGSYEYFLHQGGLIDPTDGDWYLRSELPVDPPVDPVDPVDPPVDPVDPVDPPVDPVDPVDPPVDPVDPVDPPTDPIVIDPPVLPPPPKIYRPEAGAYLANQVAAAGMFDMTLHERLGEPNLAQRLKSDDTLTSAWVRTTSDHTRFNAGEGQLDVASRQSMLQVGADFAKWGDDSRGLAGVMLATGKSSNQTTSNVTGYGAKGKVDGKALGLYATWVQSADSEKGAYVDAWLQAARFKNEVQGDALATERYDSKAVTASIEAGYAMQLHEGAGKAIYLEPQAQLTYTDYSMDGDQHVETNGTTVQTVDAGGVQARLGVRLYGHDTSSEGNRVQPFVAANWIHSEGDNAVAFNGVGLVGGQPSDVYELKAGAQLQMGGGWTGWGELGAQRGDYGFRNYGAQMGVKYSW